MTKQKPFRGIFGTKNNNEIKVLQVSERHDQDLLFDKTNIIDFFNAPLSRFFGDYIKKIKKDEKLNINTAEPYINKGIEVSIMYKKNFFINLIF